MISEFKMTMIDESMALNLTDVVTGSFRSQIAAKLRSYILTGFLKPGQVYTVAQFVESFGCSATPIREALIDLANSQLVEIKRNKGFIVKSTTKEDLDEIFDIRILLEVAAAADIAGKISAYEHSVLRGHAKNIVQSAEDGDVDGFLNWDRVFHLYLVGLRKNIRLTKSVMELRDQARLFGLRQIQKTNLLVNAAKEHVEIADIIFEGTKDEALAIMRTHIEHTRGVWASDQEEILYGDTEISV